MIGQYLVHCYLYYILDHSIISDVEFDQMCKEILKNWDEITHPHKHLLDKEALEAGSGFHISEREYPAVVRCTATLIRDYAAMGRDYLEELRKEWR